MVEKCTNVSPIPTIAVSGTLCRALLTPFSCARLETTIDNTRKIMSANKLKVKCQNENEQSEWVNGRMSEWRCSHLLLACTMYIQIGERKRTSNTMIDWTRFDFDKFFVRHVYSIATLPVEINRLSDLHKCLFRFNEFWFSLWILHRIDVMRYYNIYTNTQINSLDANAKNIALTQLVKQATPTRQLVIRPANRMAILDLVISCKVLARYFFGFYLVPLFHSSITMQM